MSEDTRICAALTKVGCVVTSFNATEQQARCTLRVPPNVSPQWVLCFRHMLQASKRASWSVDVSRTYFLRGSDDKVFYIWRVIFQAPDGLEKHVPEIVNTITSAPRAKVEVQEVQLVGASTAYRNGKGAKPLLPDREYVPEAMQLALNKLRGG